MTFRLVILGRPNVGKSTLFNRLCGVRAAIVDSTPGVTRDRRSGKARLGDLDFEIIDTAGLDEAIGDSVEGQMQTQTRRALEEADLALMLIDARSGITPVDRHFADQLRKAPVPVLLVANKCEGGKGKAGLYESYEIGFGDPVPISAEHGEGMVDLYNAIQPYVDAAAEREGQSEENADDADQENQPLQLAIVGRPNVGKSTLLNQLIDEDRMITGPMPGLTRDSIAVSWQWDGRPVKLYDTAGLRRRARVTDKLERLSAADTLRAIRFAHVVVLVLDGTVMAERQDLSIAQGVIEEGRALVIAVNKWDLVDDRDAQMEKLTDRLQISLPQVRGVPIVTLSALTGDRVDRLMPAILKAYEFWNKRLPTGPLNRWLDDMLERHPPPLSQGRRLKLRYITQVKARPPTFVIFASRPGDLPESYTRYLVNGIRETFDIDGVPIRINFRRGKNPYSREGGDKSS